MDHAEVVETPRGDEFVVESDQTGGGGVIEREVEVEYVRGLALERLGDEAQQQAVGLGLFAHDAEHGEHVLLGRDAVALVDGAVEVDGQMGYGEQRTVKLEQLHAGVHGVVATQGHTSGQREGTVEPCIEYRAAIDLDVELDHAAVRHHLGVGLDPQRGRVAVGRDDAESV